MLREGASDAPHRRRLHLQRQRQPRRLLLALLLLLPRLERVGPGAVCQAVPAAAARRSPGNEQSVSKGGGGGGRGAPRPAPRLQAPHPFVIRAVQHKLKHVGGAASIPCYGGARAGAKVWRR